MKRRQAKSAKQGGTAGPSQRQLRVGELIRHRIAELLSRGEIHDDVLSSTVVTVSEVRLSPDLKLATVYIMPLGGLDSGEIVAALERNRRFIRGATMSGLGLKFAPELRFRYDETFDEAQRIDALLHDPAVRRDIEK
ncbi:MAG: hypothetical protein RLZ98_437 [Pseudomonadota bacterium]|jgi:ribosome-binding factor A